MSENSLKAYVHVHLRNSVRSSDCILVIHRLVSRHRRVSVTDYNLVRESLTARFGGNEGVACSHARASEGVIETARRARADKSNTLAGIVEIHCPWLADSRN